MVARKERAGLTAYRVRAIVPFFRYSQKRHKKALQTLSRLKGIKTWQRPTFPGGPSIIGAGGLNDRVRDGNGCDPSAVVTRNQISP